MNGQNPNNQFNQGDVNGVNNENPSVLGSLEPQTLGQQPQPNLNGNETINNMVSNGQNPENTLNNDVNNPVTNNQSLDANIGTPINNNGQFPDDEAMMDIYEEIVGQAGSEEMVLLNLIK